MCRRQPTKQFLFLFPPSAELLTYLIFHPCGWSVQTTVFSLPYLPTVLYANLPEEFLQRSFTITAEYFWFVLKRKAMRKGLNLVRSGVKARVFSPFSACKMPAPRCGPHVHPQGGAPRRSCRAGVGMEGHWKEGDTSPHPRCRLPSLHAGAKGQSGCVWSTG